MSTQSSVVFKIDWWLFVFPPWVVCIKTFLLFYFLLPISLYLQWIYYHHYVIGSVVANGSSSVFVLRYVGAIVTIIFPATTAQF